MSLLSVNVLRTTSSAGEAYSESLSPSEWLVFYPLSEMPCSPSDEFWPTPSSLSRLVSLDECFTPNMSIDDSEVIFHRTARSVSRTARENYTGDLSLDDDTVDDIFMSEEEIPFYLQTSRSATAAPRTVEAPLKLKILRTARDIEPVFDKDFDASTLHLGEGGRQRLKSLLSTTTKCYPEMKERVSRIGKVKFASIPQLFQMAKVCGLWSEAVLIATTSHGKQQLSYSKAS